MEQKIYYEDNVKKRQGKREVWATYWAVLRSKTISLYAEKNDVENEDAECCEYISITPGSRCAIVKRRTYSFRFKLVTEEGAYFFKCESNLQRHRWMHAIELVAKERDLHPLDRQASVKLAEGRLTDSELRRYFYGEKDEEIEVNNNNSNFKTKPELSIRSVRSAKLSSLGARETSNLRNVKFLPWKEQRQKGHSENTNCSKDLGSPVENLAFSDDEVDLSGISSERDTRGGGAVRHVHVQSAGTN